LKLAVSRSRLPVPYGANLLHLHHADELLFYYYYYSKSSHASTGINILAL